VIGGRGEGVSDDDAFVVEGVELRALGRDNSDRCVGTTRFAAATVRLCLSLVLCVRFRADGMRWQREKQQREADSRWLCY
jgi:hypothetical protein